MEYFEDLADLIEEEKETEYDEAYYAIDGTSSMDMGEILENYMDEIQNSIPDEEQELYMTIENIKTSLLFLCQNLESPETKSQFTEELINFKNWYVLEKNVIYAGKKTSVMDALASLRGNKITGEKEDYDFTGALTYELRDLNFSLGKFSKIDILGDSENSKANQIN